ncbi:ribosomal maturation YjgA family protein [Mucilaginibacter glaciei]|uniref:DUF2809 domain-containing protein n=1 Tax=Mucilaginibacter glaciei TaxID=2772109 RepID=A0A926NP64_9SPHI|nr:DUF2809 domain-containing protein [Mucilaginibacter glaciei]MBD1393361.1 DUF2809 domain-containing protein [Mucilaginibacter glaciei]
MLKFNPVYFAVTILLFVIEVLIGMYMHDDFIRPFGGDFLVVILLYCFVKTFVNSNINHVVIGVLLFACLIEALQYFHFINLIGLQNSGAARLIMGTDFAWMDMLMYTLGIMLVWITESMIKCL